MGIIRTRNADISAVYERNADMLFRLALSYLQCSADAQDAVQDVFVAYMKQPKPFEDAAHERAWFVRVTINRCLDLLRRKKVRGYVPLDEIAETLAQPDDEKASLAAEVAEYLARIPEKHRAAVVLHHLEGYSIEETAKLLDISVSAVKMRLTRGREALRSVMQKEDNHV